MIITVSELAIQATENHSLVYIYSFANCIEADITLPAKGAIQSKSVIQKSFRSVSLLSLHPHVNVGIKTLCFALPLQA